MLLTSGSCKKMLDLSRLSQKKLHSPDYDVRMTNEVTLAIQALRRPYMSTAENMPYFLKRIRHEKIKKSLSLTSITKLSLTKNQSTSDPQSIFFYGCSKE